MAMSICSQQSSVMTKKISNLDISGGESLMLDLRFFVLSYLPMIGFIAANIEHLALSVACMPALVMDIVCCSMASCMATESLSYILSNSSMQQIPLSASIRAPASRVKSPVSGSLDKEAVKPAAEDPLPDVYIVQGM